MEDYLLREIDRIGDMLVQIGRRLGLFGVRKEAVPIEDFKSAVTASGLDLNIDEVLDRDNPVAWLVEQKQFSEKAVETFTDILMHSDADEETRLSFLNDSISYLDSKGYFSFLLHSYLK